MRIDKTDPAYLSYDQLSEIQHCISHMIGEHEKIHRNVCCLIGERVKSRKTSQKGYAAQHDLLRQLMVDTAKLKAAQKTLNCIFERQFDDG